MTTEPKLYGVYSQAASEQFGTVIYKGVNGSEVSVTAVYSDKESPDYKWPDKVLIGEVTQFVRQGRPSSSL